MNLSNSLIDKIRTRRDVLETIDKLGMVISRSFEKNQTIKGLLESYFDQETLEAVVETLGNTKTKDADQTQVLKTLKSTLETLPNLRLTVAIKPTVRMVESLSRTIRKEVNPQMTVEFDVDPKVIGGAVIVSNGKVFDHTVKRTVDEFFSKNQDKIMAKIHHE